MLRIVIFGGTTEGRELAEYLAGKQVELHVCVATEYGASLLPEGKNLRVHVGKIDEADMEKMFNQVNPHVCVDATHPYAVAVTENVYHACKNTETKYIRVLRQEDGGLTDDDYAGLCQNTDIAPSNLRTKDTYITSGNIKIKNCGSVEEAANFLAGTEGRIFITTGSKELEKYRVIPDYGNRCIARVLPSMEVVEKCISLGFAGRNLICMQGPFSSELNCAMLKQTGAAWMVTKSTGKEGGFQAKLDGAVKAGVNILIVGRPKEQTDHTMTFEEAKALLGAMLEADYYDTFVGRCKD